jgi:hypothetical protein
MVVHLFFAFTVSIRWRLLFPTLCWSINTKSMYIPLTFYPRRTSRYSDILALRNTVYCHVYRDVTGKPVVWLQSISVKDAVNPLVAFYDIHGRKREVLFFCSVPDTTRDFHIFIYSFISYLNRVSALGVRSRKLSNIGRSSDGWSNIYYLKLLRASEGTLSCWSRLHLQSLAPTNPHWARVVGYGPISLVNP